MRGRLCGAPRSTSLTLRETHKKTSIIRFKLTDAELFVLYSDNEFPVLPVVAQRLHVNIDGGGVWSRSALRTEKKRKTIKRLLSFSNM